MYSRTHHTLILLYTVILKNRRLICEFVLYGLLHKLTPCAPDFIPEIVIVIYSEKTRSIGHG